MSQQPVKLSSIKDGETFKRSLKAVTVYRVVKRGISVHVGKTHINMILCNSEHSNKTFAFEKILAVYPYKVGYK